jgi:hypothetical protein
MARLQGRCSSSSSSSRCQGIAYPGSCGSYHAA